MAYLTEKLRDRKVYSAAVLFCASISLAILIGAAVVLFQGTVRFILPAICLGSIAVLFSLRDTLLPLIFLVLVLPFDELLLVGDPANALSLPTLLILPGGLMLFSILGSILLHRKMVWVHQGPAYLAILLGVLATISAVMDGGAEAVLVHARRYWLVIALFLMVPTVLAERKDFSRLAWALTLSLGLSGGLAFLIRAQEFLELLGQANININQFHGLPLAIGDKNIVAMQLSAGIPFGLFLAFSETTRIRRNLPLFLVILMVLGLIAMVSVGATAGFLVILLLLLIFTSSKGQRVRFLTLGILALCILFSSPVSGRIIDQVQSIKTDAPSEWGSDRGLNWTIAFLAIMDSPWIGQGPGIQSLTEFGTRYIPFNILKWKMSNNRGYTPHNIFLAIGAELGIPALLVFTSLLLAVLLPLWGKARARQAEPGGRRKQTWTMPQIVFIAAIGLLVQGIGLSVQVDKYLWLLLGMAAALPGLPNQVEPSTETSVN